MSVKETFVDCIITATLRDGVVRLDFGELGEAQPGQGKGKEPQAQPMTAKHRLVLPVQGFVRAMQVMQEVHKRIEESNPGKGGNAPKLVVAEPPTKQ